LIALFVALTGTAYAGTQVASHQANPGVSKAKKKKVKRGPAGPPGPAGQQGAKGDAGSPGSPAASVNTGVVGFSGAIDAFAPVSGASTVTTANPESDVQSLAPAGASFTARDLSLSLPNTISNPSVTASMTLRVNGADTALSCTVPVPGNSCQDLSHAVTIPPNSRLSMHIQFLITGGGTAGANKYAFGWRAVS
jgi:hypothetical protein